jgi:crotonobetainyl-CoA:carnitine CoA-transferase CaiB-like acyl-CoA transferase
MERLGLGYEDLSVANPRLVFGSVTGFGRTGPYADVKGYEALVMARVGALWASQAMVSREGPAHVSVPYCSYGASQQLLTGICAALHERERSGLGQRVDATLVNGVASLGTWNWYLNIITSKFPDAFTPSSPIGQHGTPLTPMVFMLLIALSEDGRWLQFSQVQLHLYIEMLKVMGLDWMLQDDEWKDAVWAADIPKTGEFWDRLYEAVQSKTLAEWNQVFEDDHDVWAETMRHGSELLDHPQMQHLGAVVEIDDAERGLVRQPGPIVNMSETPAVLERGAPMLDTDGAALRAAPWPALGTDGLSGTASESGEAALGDVTVLELGTFFAAPFGGTVLREVGARVIKVEPLEGEPMRGLLPFPEVGGAKCVQGKESICVDLSSEEGRAIVHALARKSDIVLQSFRAGVSKRQGVDAETLRAVNPGLVYLNSPGYGIDGPCGDRPAYAPTIGAGSGLVMRNIGTAIEERPGLSLKEIRADALRLSGAGTTEYAQADGISALTAASAMALGLLVRDRTGVSQEMLTTMLTSTAHALADDMAEYKDRPPTQAADAELLGYSALYRLYRAAEEWIYLAAPSADDWSALCTALIDEVDLPADERFTDGTARRSNDDELARVLEDVFASKPAQHWEDTLLAAGVGCVVAHREPPESVLQSAEFAGAADMLVEVEHPTFGNHVRLKPYVSFSRSAVVAEPGVLAGQQTDAILSELGYSAESIADLRDRKVVA